MGHLERIDVLAERAEVDGRADGRTICDVLADNADIVARPGAVLGGRRPLANADLAGVPGARGPILEFFAGIGLPILEVYGMTEDTGPATANTPTAGRLGTVGRALPGVEVRLAEDGELLIRGGNVAAGYYGDEEKTGETFDLEGWLHSGDVATMDGDGFVTIVDRKKQLLITAGGKNIAPSNLESLLKRHPLVGQACVVGDRKPCLAGPDRPGRGGRAGLGPPETASRSRTWRPSPESRGWPRRSSGRVDEANERLSQAERIKRFVILPTEWTVDSEEVTPTLKLKRRVTHRKYAGEIEDLYA